MKEHYDEHYLGYEKVIIAGIDVNNNNIEIELTQEQKFNLEAFNTQLREMRFTFFRELLNAQV